MCMLLRLRRRAKTAPNTGAGNSVCRTEILTRPAGRFNPGNWFDGHRFVFCP
jgi:hypothetical protein